MTIYIYNFFFFILFHLLFAYVITMNFCIVPSVAEWFLIGWVITLLIEEYRQLRVQVMVRQTENNIFEASVEVT